MTTIQAICFGAILVMIHWNTLKIATALRAMAKPPTVLRLGTDLNPRTVHVMDQDGEALPVMAVLVVDDELRIMVKEI